MLALLLGCLGSPSAPPPPAAPSVWAGHVLLERGTAGLAADQPVCTVVALHGRGDAPENFASLFADLPGPVQVVLPRAPDRIGPKGWDWLLSGGRSTRDPALMAERAAALAAGLPDLPTPRPVAGKPVITGFSQGGMLSYTLAVRHPEAVRAALPVAGALPPELLPGPAGPSAPPITGFHGGLDQITPVQPIADAVDALHQGGWPAQLRVYPDAPHSVPPAMARDLHAALTAACATP